MRFYFTVFQELFGSLWGLLYFLPSDAYITVIGRLYGLSFWP